MHLNVVVTIECMLCMFYHSFRKDKVRAGLSHRRLAGHAAQSAVPWQLLTAKLNPNDV